MESYVRLGENYLKKKYYVPLHGGGGGVKNCKNHHYVINEWPLKHILLYNLREKALAWAGF